jgi:putative aldouronate transport system substrate-binding protein
VELKIIQNSWGDFEPKMKVIINTGDDWDLCFTCSWINDYLQNAQRGVFLPLNDYLEKEGKGMYDAIDSRFWEAARVNGTIYGVPTEKEISNMPMWVFTKEYVDKYNIPYQDIHDLEDLEPWLKLIKENEPDVVPLYVLKDFGLQPYMDTIQSPVGIEYGDDTLTVKNLYETEKFASYVETMRKYYLAGYINPDAATAVKDNSVKRFVTRDVGQPFAENIWSKDLGYPVVASSITPPQVTNGSARGAMTAISANTHYPEKCVEFLNLVNTDEYLRNLLNYGIEGVHYEKVPVPEEEKTAAKDRPYTYDVKVRLLPKAKDYTVPYWVQGGMFNTYVLEADPVDKWAIFKEFNDEAEKTPATGFDFNVDPVSIQVAAFGNIMSEYTSTLYSGSVEPSEYIPDLNKKLKAAGIQDVIDEMQRQIDQWKASK